MQRIFQNNLQKRSRFLFQNKVAFYQSSIQLHSKVGPAKELQNRELLFQCTNDILTKNSFYSHISQQYNAQAEKQVDRQKQFSAYAGFDPTADSLHMGNLISILTMIRLSLLGIKPILLVGGATGLIGDPSGKTQERNMLTKEEVLNNVQGIENTLRKCTSNIYSFLEKNKEKLEIDFIPAKEDLQIINNYDFYKDMNILDFIRDIGKHFRMGNLLNKETIANRLNTEDGLSYTEFTYTLLQGYDFEKLFLDKNCIIQVGGSDQWGNITSGIELIRRKHRAEVYGITTNLVLTAQGKKFGKSEGNALWLDPAKTKSYDIYQYLINIPDQLSINYLKMFSFLPLHQIEEIEKKHMEDAGKRLAQNILAEQIIGMVQGESQSADQGVQSTAQKFFTTDFSKFNEKSESEILEFFSSFSEKHTVERKDLQKYKNYIDMIGDLKLLKNKAEIKRNIESGGAYINNKRISLIDSDNLQTLLSENLLANRFLVARFGKKNYYLIEVK
ncbi:hypothetical protein ABPG74_012186 [Tetrahymena malaccensis]